MKKHLKIQIVLVIGFTRKKIYIAKHVTPKQIGPKRKFTPFYSSVMYVF